MIGQISKNTLYPCICYTMARIFQFVLISSIEEKHNTRDEDIL